MDVRIPFHILSNTDANWVIVSVFVVVDRHGNEWKNQPTAQSFSACDAISINGGRSQIKHFLLANLFAALIFPVGSGKFDSKSTCVRRMSDCVIIICRIRFSNVSFTLTPPLSLYGVFGMLKIIINLCGDFSQRM